MKLFLIPLMILITTAQASTLEEKTIEDLTLRKFIGKVFGTYEGRPLINLFVPIYKTGGLHYDLTKDPNEIFHIFSKFLSKSVEEASYERPELFVGNLTDKNFVLPSELAILPNSVFNFSKTQVEAVYFSYLKTEYSALGRFLRYFENPDAQDPEKIIDAYIREAISSFSIETNREFKFYSEINSSYTYRTLFSFKMTQLNREMNSSPFCLENLDSKGARKKSKNVKIFFSNLLRSLYHGKSAVLDPLE